MINGEAMGSHDGRTGGAAAWLDVGLERMFGERLVDRPPSPAPARPPASTSVRGGRCVVVVVDPTPRKRVAHCT